MGKRTPFSWREVVQVPPVQTRPGSGISTKADRPGNALVSEAMTFCSLVPLERAYYNTFSYPLAYSLVVLPLSVARWSLIDHRNVPSAAMFFGLAMFNLSGAVNVLLFLIVRPQILLFAPPEQPVEAEKQLSHLNTGPVILTETAGCECNPEPTGMGLAVDLGEGSWNCTFEGSRNVALSRVSSSQRSASNRSTSRAQV
jgi:hypothetical protein